MRRRVQMVLLIFGVLVLLLVALMYRDKIEPWFSKRDDILNHSVFDGYLPGPLKKPNPG